MSSRKSSKQRLAAKRWTRGEIERRMLAVRREWRRTHPPSPRARYTKDVQVGTIFPERYLGTGPG